ncbi:DUF167 domain-containing protein [Bartonella sp. DGB1]|uniref:DUF167 domain-containing protein n=1 Tax=Bartonella sp. DGB1 TaxID=3239807 RepID=UPI003523F6AF
MSNLYKKYLEGVLLNIKLTPNAANEKICKLYVDENNSLALVVQVREIAEDNKANIALIKLLAKKFKIAKSKITLLKGNKSRMKQLYLQGDYEELTAIIEHIIAQLGSDNS